MEISSLVIAALGGLPAAGLTLAACRWWYGRRLRDMSVRLEGGDRLRQEAAVAPPGPSSREPVAGTPDKARSSAESLLEHLEPAGSGVERLVLPAHGFADTLPICVRPNRSMN